MGERCLVGKGSLGRDWAAQPGLLGWGWGLGEVARRPGPRHPCWCFGRGPAPPPLARCAQNPCSWPPQAPPCPGNPAQLLLGRWGSRQEPQWSFPPGDPATVAISFKPQVRKMGHPPGPPRTPAPASSTAMPGLIPDLIAGIPWPRWALVLVALAAGILTVSCLLCVFCCCHRHRKKQPRDKEAVGLGSARSSTSTHLVQPDVDKLQGTPEDPWQWGRLLLSLEYDLGSEEIRVGLKQAADLRAGGAADPYARVSVSTQARRGHETKVHRGTLCPVFDETCCFHVPQAELPGTTLQVRLLDFKPFSEHEPLGELRLPLGALDPQHVLERWYQLGPPGPQEPEQTGELCFSLRYVPSSGRLTVVVLEARGLSPGLAEPYVKVQLMLDQRKWKKRKTSAKRGTASPYFNEAFTFLVPLSQIQSVDLVLAVWARGLQFRAEPVGKVLLGSRASGQPLQHWADMLAHARRPIAQWHRLRPAGEVDGLLALRPRLRLPVPRS